MKLSPAALFLSSILWTTSNADFNGLRRLPRNRNLQTACDGITRSKTCKQTAGCAWQQGECRSTSSGPTNPPTTKQPTDPPSPPPTKAPSPEGAGFCSDSSGQCFDVSECVCGNAASDAHGVEASIFERRARQTMAAPLGRRAMDCGGTATKRRDCPSTCIWLGGGGGGCVAPATLDPSMEPTRAPTPCACLGVPTQSPTEGPPTPQTQPPTIGPTVTSAATYTPGELLSTNTCDGGKLKLSTGLDCKLLTTRGQRVLLANGTLSSDSMHSAADGAAVIPHPFDGGWYYTSNSEAGSGGGGVGTLRFDSNGDVIGYEMQLTGTSRNCGGGRSPWNTWVTCEENSSSGFCHEVDPVTGFNQKVEVVGFGGNYESFAYDDQDPVKNRYFVTEDASSGALTRYTPDDSAYSSGNNYDVLSSSGGVYEYLVLNDSDMTFTWSSSRTEGRNNAAALFPRSEGIDVHNRILSFVAKSIKKLFTLDLEAQTWSETSTLSGAFNLQPDQLARIIGDGDILYFCEDGGSACDIHARDSTGQFFTIVEGIGYSTETTGLAFSPDSRFMYVAFQGNSNIYSFWRTDGLPFNGIVADTKYH